MAKDNLLIIYDLARLHDLDAFSTSLVSGLVRCCLLNRADKPRKSNRIERREEKRSREEEASRLLFDRWSLAMNLRQSGEAWRIKKNMKNSKIKISSFLHIYK